MNENDYLNQGFDTFAEKRVDFQNMDPNNLNDVMADKNIINQINTVPDHSISVNKIDKSFIHLAGFQAVTIDNAQATGNTDTVILTTGTPQIIILEFNLNDNATGAGNPGGYLKLVYLGSVLVSVLNQTHATNWATAVTFQTLSNGLTASTNPTLTFGSGGDTQALTVSVSDVGSNSFTVRAATVKTGTGNATDLIANFSYIVIL